MKWILRRLNRLTTGFKATSKKAKPVSTESTSYLTNRVHKVLASCQTPEQMKAGVRYARMSGLWGSAAESLWIEFENQLTDPT